MMCARATRAHCLDGDLFLGSVEHSKKSKWTGQRRREIAGARMAALLLFGTRPRTWGGGGLERPQRWEMWMLWMPWISWDDGAGTTATLSGLF